MSALYKGPSPYERRHHSGIKQKHSTTPFMPYAEAKLQMQPQPQITNMVRISKENVERYNAVLGSLGCRKVSLDSFSIDKSGYSEEVAAILGKDYLKNNIIIVSPEQSNAPLIREDYSFLEELTNRVYSDAQNLIGIITPKEPLYGSIGIMPNPMHGPAGPEAEKNLYSMLLLKPSGGYANGYADCNSAEKEKYLNLYSKQGKLNTAGEKEKEPKFSIAVSLDTPDKTVTKLEEVVNEIDSLDENKNLLLNTGYVNSIFGKIAKLNEKYGDIRQLKVKIPHVAFEVPSFALMRSKYAIYGFAGRAREKSEEPKSNENLIVYRSDESLIVYLGKSRPKEGSEWAKIKGAFYASDKDVLLSELMNAGYIYVDKDLIEKTLHEMERQTLEKSNLNFESLDLMERYKKLEELKEKLPNEFSELWEAVKDKAYFNRLDRKLKFKIIKPTNEDKTLARLLEAIERSDPFIGLLIKSS